MMYRRSAAVTPRMEHHAAAAQISAADAVKGAILQMLMKVGLVAQAERENRRWERLRKRAFKSTTYFSAGLNGRNAVARRRRQIAAGQLTAANGLA